jgi:hypothetical protein
MKVELLSRFTTLVHINIVAQNNPTIKKPHRITTDKKEICISSEYAVGLAISWCPIPRTSAATGCNVKKGQCHDIFDFRFFS